MGDLKAQVGQGREDNVVGSYGSGVRILHKKKFVHVKKI